MQPKVSIIVPTYNVEMYLEECLESIIHQTLKDIEVICIDDGSKDNSGKILDEYASKDKRIKVIHKENGGYGKAMNVGLDHATGEYIGIVEPDDFVELNMYETLYNKALENNVDLIKADFNRFVGEKGSRTLFYNKLDESGKNYNKIIKPSENIFSFKFIMNTWSGIYKRSFIEKYHIRHNETPGASYQDNGFWFQTFAMADRAYFYDAPFYMNRRDNENSSVKSKGKVYAMKGEYDFILEFLKKNQQLYKKLIGIYWFKKFQNYLGTFYRIDISFKKEFLKHFQKEFKKADKIGELDRSLFPLDDYKNLELIMKKPNKFYYHSLGIHTLSFMQRMFSVSNKKSNNGKWHKIIYILGIRVSLRNKSKEKRLSIKA